MLTARISMFSLTLILSAAAHGSVFEPDSTLPTSPARTAPANPPIWDDGNLPKSCLSSPGAKEEIDSLHLDLEKVRDDHALEIARLKKAGEWDGDQSPPGPKAQQLWLKYKSNLQEKVSAIQSFRSECAKGGTDIPSVAHQPVEKCTESNLRKIEALNAERRLRDDASASGDTSRAITQRKQKEQIDQTIQHFKSECAGKASPIKTNESSEIKAMRVRIQEHDSEHADLIAKLRENNLMPIIGTRIWDPYIQTKKSLDHCLIKLKSGAKCEDIEQPDKLVAGVIDGMITSCGKYNEKSVKCYSSRLKALDALLGDQSQNAGSPSGAIRR